MSISVIYQGRVAAMADEASYVYAPHVDILELTHPVRRFVRLMAIYAHRFEQRRVGLSDYRNDDAEMAARFRLMPAEHFEPLSHLGDALLASTFGVPLEQIGPRRRDAALDEWTRLNT